VMHSSTQRTTPAERDGRQLEARALMQRSEAARSLSEQAMKLSRRASGSASDARVRAHGAHLRAEARLGPTREGVQLPFLALPLVPVPAPAKRAADVTDVALDQAA